MADCEGGHGDFRQLHGEKHLAERERLQARFISILKRFEIHGVSISVAIKPFRKYEPKIKALCKPHVANIVKPHLLAAHGIGTAATRVIDLLPPDEQTEFIFDRKFEYEGAVEDFLKLETLGPVPRRNRYGPTRHGDKTKDIALQAADILAYEEYRRVTGARDRWQLFMLENQIHSRANMNDRYFRMLLRSWIAMGFTPQAR